MEKHTCKLCFRRFPSGRALGGHMHSHVPVTYSESSGEEVELELEGKTAAGGFYGLRENPRKSFKVVDPEFSSPVDYSFFYSDGTPTKNNIISNNNNNNSSSAVVQDRESETESSKPPTSFRRRSKRRRRLDVEPLSSVSDTTPDEDVAYWLVMLSRDTWEKQPDCPTQALQVQDEVEVEEEVEVEVEVEVEEDEDEYNNNNRSRRSRFQCATCKKVFRSYQALGGHRASHKKVRNCGGSWLPEQIRQVTVEDTKKTHKCPFCPRVFSSGQALGGHKRSHLSASGASTSNAVVEESFIDLNLPAPIDDDGSYVVEFSAVSNLK